MPAKKWIPTDEEIKLMVTMRNEGCTLSEIGKAVGKTKNGLVSGILKDLGVEKKYKSKCRVCNISISTNDSFCSEECSETYRLQRLEVKKREYNSKKKLTRCVYCYKWHSRKYEVCSTECSKRKQSNRKVISRKERMDKAKQNGHFDIDIDVYKLVKRDGDKCYLCNNKTSFELDYNDPKYPTIEHVLAISNGGTHSWGNVKVACRECNTRKGSKPLNKYKEVS